MSALIEPGPAHHTPSGASPETRPHTRVPLPACRYCLFGQAQHARVVTGSPFVALSRAAAADNLAMVRAVEALPRGFQAQQSLATAVLGRRNAALALESGGAGPREVAVLLDEALALAPSYPVLLRMRATCHAAAGEWADAHRREREANASVDAVCDPRSGAQHRWEEAAEPVRRKWDRVEL